MPWSKAPVTAITPRAARHAKALRRALTGPETRLLWHLRHRLPIEGTHFRRQVAIDGYVADFCCHARRVIVEVDGNQHGFDARAAYDAQRTMSLASRGYRVLRFSNHAVMREIDSVLETIAVALAAEPMDIAMSGATPTPGPSPQGGGE